MSLPSIIITAVVIVLLGIAAILWGIGEDSD